MDTHICGSRMIEMGNENIVDVDIKEQKMEQYLKKEELFFDAITNAHLKYIENVIFNDKFYYGNKTIDTISLKKYRFYI